MSTQAFSEILVNTVAQRGTAGAHGLLAGIDTCLQVCFLICCEQGPAEHNSDLFSK